MTRPSGAGHARHVDEAGRVLGRAEESGAPRDWNRSSDYGHASLRLLRADRRRERLGERVERRAVELWANAAQYRPQDQPPTVSAGLGDCRHLDGKADRLEEPLEPGTIAYPLSF